MPFEILNIAFVLFSSFARVEGSQIFPFARFRIDFSGIKTIVAALELPNHAGAIAVEGPPNARARRYFV
jgi:hypothetical protein